MAKHLLVILNKYIPKIAVLKISGQRDMKRTGKDLNRAMECGRMRYINHLMI